jgi:hypothetical protein
MDKVLIWSGMSIFWNLPTWITTVKIKNNTPSDIYLNNNVCVYMSWANVINRSNNICEPFWIINALDTKEYFTNIKDYFTATTEYLPWTDTYWDAQLIITLWWYKDIDTFLKSFIDVRVAKWTVNTLWWWASLLKWTKFSDVNKLSNWFGPLKQTKNKNLILASLWVDPLSSYVKKTNNSTLITKSNDEWKKEINNFTWVTVEGTLNTRNSLPIDKFNGFENVFIHKWDVTLNFQTISWWNKTYIINGNLTISGDITSSGNILFVVKNWTVTIKNNVKKIEAILIDIWWNINWESTSTTERLVINGALYWNIEDLLSKRTYIKNDSELVNVWTNINFTSKIFNSPPPLLSSFLWEYTESKKVAK